MNHSSYKRGTKRGAPTQLLQSLCLLSLSLIQRPSVEDMTDRGREMYNKKLDLLPSLNDVPGTSPQDKVSGPLQLEVRGGRLVPSQQLYQSSGHCLPTYWTDIQYHYPPLWGQLKKFGHSHTTREMRVEGASQPTTVTSCRGGGHTTTADGHDAPHKGRPRDMG